MHRLHGDPGRGQAGEAVSGDGGRGRGRRGRPAGCCPKRPRRALRRVLLPAHVVLKLHGQVVRLQAGSGTMGHIRIWRPFYACQGIEGGFFACFFGHNQPIKILTFDCAKAARILGSKFKFTCHYCPTYYAWQGKHCCFGQRDLKT